MTNATVGAVYDRPRFRSSTSWAVIDRRTVGKMFRETKPRQGRKIVATNLSSLTGLSLAENFSTAFSRGHPLRPLRGSGWIDPPLNRLTPTTQFDKSISRHPFRMGISIAAPAELCAVTILFPVVGFSYATSIPKPPETVAARAS